MRRLLLVRSIFALVLMTAVLGGRPSSVSAQMMDTARVAPEPDRVAIVPDSLLSARLQTIYRSIEGFREVTVAVAEGVVRLGGTVADPETRRRAAELAASLEGVVYVVNEIETATDVETRITPAVVRLQEYWDGFVQQLPVIAVALIVLLLFALLGWMLGRWRRPLRWTRVNPLVWGFISRLLRGILVVVGLLLAFDILGITSLMGAVLGTAGIVGLALGFAFRDIVENYLAGMLLSLRRPFTVNDFIRIGEYEGRIVRLTSRELVLLTLEGNNVRLPNAHVFKTPFINYTSNPRRLFSVDVEIGIQEDVKTAMAVGIETLQAMKGVLEDPAPFARFIQMKDATVLLRFSGWVDQRDADFLKVQSEALRLVKAALEGAGVQISEPTLNVLARRIPIEEEVAAQDTADRRPTEPAVRPMPVRDEAASVDVDPDRKIDEQVQEDLARSDDENLLE